jgi:hypothetical protein
LQEPVAAAAAAAVGCRFMHIVLHLVYIVATHVLLSLHTIATHLSWLYNNALAVLCCISAAGVEAVYALLFAGQFPYPVF